MVGYQNTSTRTVTDRDSTENHCHRPGLGCLCNGLATDVNRISSPSWSGTRKRPYLGKDITVTHTQTGILVGKCGQNVGKRLTALTAA